MNRTARLAVALVAAAGLAGSLGACAVSPGDDGGSRASAAPDPRAAAVTALPGYTPSAGEPTLTGMASARPPAGTVGRIAGPFDDRFRLDRLRFSRTAVTGTVVVTSDVSDLLELQVLAGFYDASGALVGTGRFTHHLDEQTHTDNGPPSQKEDFSIAVPPSLRGVVTAAAVGVPVLVNE